MRENLYSAKKIAPVRRGFRIFVRFMKRFTMLFIIIEDANCTVVSYKNLDFLVGVLQINYNCNGKLVIRRARGVCLEDNFETLKYS